MRRTPWTVTSCSQESPKSYTYLVPILRPAHRLLGLASDDFLDLVVTAPAELAVLDERTGLFSDPPADLLADVAWEVLRPSKTFVRGA